jgi:hypothetical protein
MTAGLPVTDRIVPFTRQFAILVTTALVVVLAGCGGGGGEGDAQQAAVTPPASAPPASAPPTVAANHAPTISGTSMTSVLVGTAYSFTPSASDADNNTLTFSISGRPAWATFSATTGRLSGTPGPGDVATYSNIVISVSDGTTQTALAAFNLTVVATSTGAATLSWTPPTQNTDGTPLTDLSGYRVYWGTSQANLANSVTLNNPGLTSYVVDQLTPATWYFATTALSSKGIESNRSNVASKTIL